MRIKVDCKYCGHIVIVTVYSSYHNPESCIRCKDTNLKITPIEDSEIDYYQTGEENRKKRST